MAATFGSSLINGGQEKDRIQELLLQDIHDFRMESMHNFGITLFVWPSRESNPVHINSVWVGFDAYVFDLFGEKPKEMRVRLSTKGETISVEIRYQNVWCRVDSYLKHLQPPAEWNDPQEGLTYQLQRARYDQQARWWAANKKKFPILGLPSEIRELIYSFAFGPRVEPYPKSKARNLGQNTVAILRRRPNTSLLRLDRAIYEEASHILFHYKPFYVEHLPVLEKLLSKRDQFSRIRQLALALTHSHFLKLFGLDADEIVFEPKPAAKSLEVMKLHRLEINFAAPSSKTSRSWLDDACQKTVVDWILKAAWPYIRRHPVTLTGYIKNSSRSRFDQWLGEEKSRIDIWQLQRLAGGMARGDHDQYYADLDDEEGGVRLDVQQTNEETSAASNEIVLPPRCFCKKRCTVETWTDED